MNLTDVCVRKPVLAWMLMAATVVFGIVAIGRIGISQFPDVDFPTINVSVVWEGAAPEVIENDVVEVLEEALAQTEGMKSITSVSRMGSANITIELDLSRNVDIALQDVQTKVSQATRRLPRDIDPPVISKTNPEDQPILSITLRGPFPQRVLSDYVRYGLREKLQTIPGVGEISLMGALDRNVRVWLDATKLDEKGLSVLDVITALQREHVELPAGRLETPGREMNVRVLGEALDLETLRQIVVREVSGSPIYISDVALVEDGFEDVRRLARVNGAQAQGMMVRKQRGANAVSVARAVHQAVDDYQKTLPEGMSVSVGFDSTEFIKDSVTEIQFELILSVLLTALVCWMFLGSLSSTLNVILAIPMSLMGTIAIIYFLGFTFNTFTLLGLALAVGIVVDDAIMVMENIFRHREGGKGLVRAALDGTHEIAFAALAATLAVVAIFIPVVFMKGVIGRFFLQFGITLCLAVLLSYVEAVTLAPARCSQFLKTSREGRSRFGRFVDDGFRRLEGIYAKVLGRGLRRPGIILVAALLVFAAALVVLRMLPGEFVPSQDLSRLSVRFQTAVGSDITETDKLMQKVEGVFYSHPEITQLFSIVGGMWGGGINSGMIFANMVEPKEREMTQAEFSAVLRRELNSIPGVRAVIQDLSQQGFTAQRGFPVEFSVRGSNWEGLVETSQNVMTQVASSGLVVDLDTDYQLGMPELQVEPDRAVTADLGISVDEVATTLNALVGGIRVGKYSSGGRRLDVRLKLLASQRTRPEDIARSEDPHARRRLDTALLARQIRREARPPGHHPPGPGAGHLHLRQCRARAFPAGSAPICRVPDQRPAGRLPDRLGGASVAFRESMSSLIFALVSGHRHRLYGPGLAVQLLQRPGHGHHHPAAVDRGGGFRPAGGRADAQRLQHDRPSAPDGDRQEKLDHPGRLCQRFQSPRR